MNRTITPQQFGALGDGVHDDVSAIQAAIDIASVLGTKVYIPGTLGGYAVGTSLLLKDNVSVEGDASRPLIKKIGTLNGMGTGPVFTNSGYAGDGNENIHLRSLTLKNSYQDFLTPIADTGETIGSMYGIKFSGVKNFSIENCHVLDSCAEAVYIGGASGDLCEDGIIKDNLIENAFASGIAITNGKRIKVVGNTIKTTRIFGINVEPNTGCVGTDIIIANNLIDGVEAGYYKNSVGYGQSNALGISLSKGSLADQTHHVNVIGNTVRNVQKYTSSGINDFANISLSGVFKCNVFGNLVTDSEPGGILLRSGSSACLVSANNISNIELQAVRVSESTDCGVTNNVIKSVGGAGIVVTTSCTDVGVDGNVIVDPTGPGILFQGVTSARLKANNNTIRDTRAGGSRTLTHGIHLSSGLTDVTVMGNQIDNMTGDAIRNVDSPAGVWVISGNNEDGTSRMKMGSGGASLFHAFSDGGIYENQWHRFIARSATGVPNNAMFLDVADNVLKFRNNAGVVQTVTLA